VDKGLKEEANRRSMARTDQQRRESARKQVLAEKQLQKIKANAASK
jgi:hypothetical protein